MINKLSRVIDANLNRTKEGLRVIEDINRYIYNDASFSKEVKKLRHSCKLSLELLLSFIPYRDTSTDVLKNFDVNTNKNSIELVLVSNYKRVQESCRSLEEIFQLVDPQISNQFKSIRYKAYDLEKEQFSKIKLTQK